MTSSLPHCGHFSPGTCTVPSSFCACVMLAVNLHSGYPEHARNFPYRPTLTTRGLPHFRQVCSVSDPTPPRLSEGSSSGFCVYLHSSFVHARNAPNFPQRLTMSLPHCGHFISTGIPVALMFSTFL